jgi:hypothetical protein
MNHDGERILSMFPNARCTQSQHFILLLFFLSATHMHPILVKKTALKSPDFKDFFFVEIAMFKKTITIFFLLK